MRQRSRVNSDLLKAVILICLLAGVLLRGQAVESVDVPHSYKGMIPGKAEIEEVKKTLGPAPIRTAKDDDLRYPVSNRSDVNDRLYFRNGKLALVTAAAPDSRYPTRAEIVRQLGEPEAQVLFQTQEYLDYTGKGLRFICTAAGQTTGVIYFQPQRRRVPDGYPNTRINLRRKMPVSSRARPLEDFRIGTAQVSISPKRFDNLTSSGKEGQLKLAEDVFARVAIFTRGETRVVLVGLDVFGMGSWDLDRLRESLARKGFKQVVIAMSHTHANVDTIGFYGYYPREYARYILRQTEAAVLKAAEDMQEVRSLRMGSVEMPLAGGRVIDLVRNARDPGLVDPTVSILQAIGVDGKPALNLIHLACHPEVIRLEDTGGISPDFVGTLCREVSRQLGGQTVFFNGALGGMLTPDTRFRTQQAAEQMGRKLAHYVVQAARKAQPSSSSRLWMLRRAVEYPITGESVARFLQNPPEPIDFHQGRMRAEMNVLWIGDAQFITVPGELLPDIAFEIMSKMNGRLRLIVGLANGELGYFVPSFDFRAGGYEERTGPGAAGGEITRSVGLELAPLKPPAGL